MRIQKAKLVDLRVEIPTIVKEAEGELRGGFCALASTESENPLSNILCDIEINLKNCKCGVVTPPITTTTTTTTPSPTGTSSNMQALLGGTFHF